MANGGWPGSKDEWARIESPLITVDPILQKLARSAGLGVTKNLKDWPERPTRCGSAISCLIQIYLGDEEGMIWNT
jgi:hypothetical protein